MDSNEMIQDIELKNFLKPRCPVNVGDRFYKNYHVPNGLILWEVTEVRDMEDKNGCYYAITAKCNNITIGQNVRTFSSRYLSNGDYTILKRGVDFG